MDKQTVTITADGTLSNHIITKVELAIRWNQNSFCVCMNGFFSILPIDERKLTHLTFDEGIEFSEAVWLHQTDRADDNNTH